jgi:hypothetical protein
MCGVWTRKLTVYMLAQTLFSSDFVSKNAFDGDSNRQAKAYGGMTVALTVIVVTSYYGWATVRQHRAKAILQRRQTLEA